jgi:hypothetical protein
MAILRNWQIGPCIEVIERSWEKRKKCPLMMLNVEVEVNAKISNHMLMCTAMQLEDSLVYVVIGIISQVLKWMYMEEKFHVAIMEERFV